MGLASSNVDGNDESMPITNDMDLGAKSASRTT
jgi:hypothetical protein